MIMENNYLYEEALDVLRTVSRNDFNIITADKSARVERALIILNRNSRAFESTSLLRGCMMLQMASCYAALENWSLAYNAIRVTEKILNNCVHIHYANLLMRFCERIAGAIRREHSHDIVDISFSKDQLDNLIYSVTTELQNKDWELLSVEDDSLDRKVELEDTVRIMKDLKGVLLYAWKRRIWEKDSYDFTGVGEGLYITNTFWDEENDKLYAEFSSLSEISKERRISMLLSDLETCQVHFSKNQENVFAIAFLNYIQMTL